MAGLFETTVPPFFWPLPIRGLLFTKTLPGTCLIRPFYMIALWFLQGSCKLAYRNLGGTIEEPNSKSGVGPSFPISFSGWSGAEAADQRR